MQTTVGHLTYCSNIHPGETWSAHFHQLQQHIPAVKKAVSPDKPFGIGLRLANTASLELAREENLRAFQQWLRENDCYVFTMNGFPYGGFHNTVVKDQVHAPDWTSPDRVAYTIRLFRLLASMLPYGREGGISTSPLSYKFWCNRCEEEKNSVMESATLNILLVVENLVRVRRSGGPLLHLDIEPEPDGLLENTEEFMDWYLHQLLPAGIPFLQDKFKIDEATAAGFIKDHVQLCYDVCHFALEYEQPAAVLEKLRAYGLKVGKIQISAALKADMPTDTDKRKEIVAAFRQFEEPVYLHQVIARTVEGGLIHYPDLPQAFADADNSKVTEWRSHFHVPVFLERYDPLSSTQADIKAVLALQKEAPFTAHLEVETYTWEVLPAPLKENMDISISRELQWVLQQLDY
ncbi:metabolite traffic protein EboE [Chitinophaga sp. sic0106]|uniref:metabolite traffic protein EboE n=1 Tax=Chitinophaga sp. sic0106 TaxID=2854785 RepID=UPI001C48DFD0|nr:metabolite traffic protein EboE [Chitinophaga sp. sic0106]MBV7532418.1 metabolite traffic protein EboE [Chitinophaga sp. sic0106]